MVIERRNITVKVADLKPYAKNARTHSKAQVDQIAASIKEFGFTNPIIVSRETLVQLDLDIIAGHGRYLAAKQLGLEEIPAVLLTGLTEAQHKALMLADNKLALNAGWDDQLLVGELMDLIKMDFALPVLGFSDSELKDLLPDVLEVALPSLASDMTKDFQQMTFTVSNDQAEQIKAAVARAKELGPYVDTGNENSNGNGLSRVCELFMGAHGIS